MLDQFNMEDRQLKSVNGTLVAIRFEAGEDASVYVEIDRLARQKDETFHNPIFAGLYDSRPEAEVEVTDFLGYWFGHAVPAPPSKGGCGGGGCGGGGG